MIVYVDGACSNNGSAAAVGGFGVIALDNEENLLSAYCKHNDSTTNNREELRAILYALITFGKETPTPIVYSDSAYAVNTLSSWCWGWERRGWLKSDNKVPENLDLIQEYCNLIRQGYKIDLRKCAGHAGNHWNEQADKLAVAAKNNSKEVIIKLLKKGNINEYKNI